MSEHLHALPEGTELEGYRIERVLGVGGFGITYLGRDKAIGKAVAIKEYLPNEFAIRAEGSTVLPKSGADRDDYDWGLERFLDEARTLAAFDHPNLNKVFRFFKANGTAYMVLEYVDGETLSARLRRGGGLPESELVRMLDGLLSGLAAVHEAGYVHRDIKPGNIMLRADGSAVLLDFGAARAALGQRSKSITAILTPGYAPVEQYDQHADDIGPWTDIYALGMVAYRCVCGCGDTDLLDAVARARLQRKGAIDKDLRPAVDAGRGAYADALLAAIDWAIQVNEEERPPSVAAWRAALLGDSGAGAPTLPPLTTGAAVGARAAGATRPGVRRPPRRGNTAWALVSVAVGLVVIAGAAAWVGLPLLQEAGDSAAEQPQLSANTPPAADIDVLATAAEAPAPAAPPVDTGKVARIENMLALAEQNFVASRYTTPPGNNASEHYRQVLVLDPGNRRAKDGLGKIVVTYLGMAERAIAREDFARAKHYLARAEAVDAGVPAIAATYRHLVAAEAALVERQRAEAERREREGEAARQQQTESCKRRCRGQQYLCNQKVAAEYHDCRSKAGSNCTASAETYYGDGYAGGGYAEQHTHEPGGFTGGGDAACESKARAECAKAERSATQACDSERRACEAQC